MVLSNLIKLNVDDYKILLNKDNLIESVELLEDWLIASLSEPLCNYANLHSSNHIVSGSHKVYRDLIFKGWVDYSGCIDYPVGLEYEWDIELESESFYDNPKRHDLAKHLIKVLTSIIDGSHPNLEN